MNFFSEGNEQYLKQNYEEAIKLYKKAIKEKENESSSHYNLAVCLIKQKKFDEAIVVLHEALKLSTNSKYFFNLAYCHMQLMDYKKAIRYFNIAWALNYSDDDCRKAIAVIMKTKN